MLKGCPVTKAATLPAFSSSLSCLRLVPDGGGGFPVLWLKRWGKVDSHWARKDPFTAIGMDQGLVQL